MEKTKLIIVPSLIDKNVFFAYTHTNEYKLFIEDSRLIYEDFILLSELEEIKKQLNVSIAIKIESFDCYGKSHVKNPDKDRYRKSKYYGVTWDKNLNKYRAYVGLKNHKQKTLGYFNEDEEIKANFAVQKELMKMYKRQRQ